MNKNSKLRAAILGVAGRGQGFISPFANMPQSELAAICDINLGLMEKVCQRFSVSSHVKKYTSYEEMLDREDIDVVFVGTPIDLHFKHTELALKKGFHVLGEVPAVFSMEEARGLVELCKTSKGSYMMAENANYFKNNLIAKEMAENGLFGELYYAEAEYLHNLKLLARQYTPWRYKCMFGKNGIVYGTHSLGPVLSWFGGDRVTKVSCSGSGHHHLDVEGKRFKLEDTCVMMCKTERERLIKIRVDFTSPRPGINRYILQGSLGAYESPYHVNDFSRVFLADRYMEEEIDYYERTLKHQQYEQWSNINDYEEQYFLPKYKEAEEEAAKHGHDGADYFMMIDYIDALYYGKPLPVDIHKSLDITLPGLISEQSIKRQGDWIDVPDSRKWEE